MSPELLVVIRYCTQCRWLLRAAWIAQELLTTFEQELDGVTLSPGTGGIFEYASAIASCGRARRKAAFPISSN